MRPGGLLVIDHYTWSVSRVTTLAWLYRLYLRRLPPERAKSVTDGLVAVFFPLHWRVRRFFPAQALLSRFSLPIGGNEVEARCRRPSDGNGGQT